MRSMAGTIQRLLVVAAVACAWLAAGVPGASATDPPALNGSWLHHGAYRGAGWANAVKVDFTATATGFIGRTAEPVTRWPEWNQGVGSLGPCPGSPPAVPAGTPWIHGALVSPGVYDVTFDYGGFDMIDEDGIQPGPASRCEIFPTTERMRLASYGESLAAGLTLPAGRPGSLIELGHVINGHYTPGVAGGFGSGGFPDCPYYHQTESDLEYCRTFSGALAEDKGDIDGDGLTDSWERRGAHIGGDFVNLPAMGADPRRKDLFVQFDSRPDTQLANSTLIHAAKVFDSAPVPNPDGRPDGISLHVDAGPDSIMDLDGERRWGGLSEAHPSLSFPDSLGSWLHPDADGCSGDYDWTDFDAIATRQLSESRKPIFRYGIAARYVGSPLCASGVARDMPSSRFLMATWGHFGPGGAPAPFGPRTRLGTFLHEFGHTLGLRHGGFDDDNFKPNYLSPMNYLYQLGGWIDPADRRHFEYSTTNPSRSTVVDESAVDESTGLAGIPAPAGSTVAWACNGAEDAFRVLTIGDPFDANCDGHVSSGTRAVNFDSNSGFQRLQTWNDWEHLSYIGGSVGGPGRAIGSTVGGSPEPIDAEQISALLRMQDSVRPRLRASVARSNGRPRLRFKARDDQGVGSVVIDAGRGSPRLINAPLDRDLGSPRRFRGSARLPHGARRVSVYAIDQSSNRSRTLHLHGGGHQR